MVLSVTIAGLVAFVVLILVFKLVRALFKFALMALALAAGAWIALTGTDAVHQRLHTLLPGIVGPPESSSAAPAPTPPPND